MPRKEEELDESILEDILEDRGMETTEQIRQIYLEKSDRESLSHKTVKRNLEQGEQFTSQKRGKSILWSVDE